MLDEPFKKIPRARDSDPAPSWQNAYVRNVEDLPDSELEELARLWRRRALEGDLHARGTAHLLETEARRRGGITIFDPASLDLRPLTTQLYPATPSLVGRLVKAGALAAGLALVALLLAYR